MKVFTRQPVQARDLCNAIRKNFPSVGTEDPLHHARAFITDASPDQVFKAAESIRIHRSEIDLVQS